MAVKMMESLKESNVTVKQLKMDDDATTFARAKALVNPNLEKISDKNHSMKAFVSDMYGIKAKHSSFSYNIIRYMKRLFSSALNQNQGKPNTIRDRLMSIPCHVFGDHTSCDACWCKALSLTDPSLYKYQALPFKCPITDTAIQTSLKDVFHKYASKANQLAQLGSSQANESLNHSIARKAPKSQHYSSSDSLLFRVGATVAEKNKGSGYTLEVGIRVKLLI